MSPTKKLDFFKCFVSNSAFFKWQMSISEATWTFSPFVLASSTTSDLFLTFFMSHADIFSSFTPFIIHFHFCCGYLHWRGHRNRFVHLIVLLHWIVLLSGLWSSWWNGRESSIRSFANSTGYRTHASFFNLLMLHSNHASAQFCRAALEQLMSPNSHEHSWWFLGDPYPPGQWNRSLAVFFAIWSFSCDHFCFSTS